MLAGRLLPAAVFATSGALLLLLIARRRLRGADHGPLSISASVLQSVRKGLRSTSAVPMIDISPFVEPSAHDDAARARVATEWDRAMTEVGFAMITGHGVAPAVIDALREGAAKFFTQPADVKTSYYYGPYGNPLGGYTGMGVEAVSRTRDEHGSDGGAESELKAALPDLVESYIFKPEVTDKPKPPALREAGAAYHRELLRVLGCLHHVTAAALGLPRDFFDPYYTPCASVSLRLAYYPPVPEASQASSAVRYGEHTDYTGFTILHQDEADVGAMDAGGCAQKAICASAHERSMPWMCRPMCAQPPLPS